MATFRVERTKNYTVMSNHHLKDRGLTLKSKGLLSMMLSLPDEWNYSTRGLAAICKEGVDAIGAALKELERAGYIIRNQIRGERGRIVDTEYIIYEVPQNRSEPPPPEKLISPPSSPHTGFPYLDNPDTVNPDMENPDMDEPDTENPAQYITKISSTQKENIDSSRKNPSIYPSIPPRPPDTRSRDAPVPDGMDRMEAYRDMVMDNIEYDLLVERYDRERLDEAVEIMLEAICSKREYIRVAGDEFPREVVKSRLLKLSSQHIEYAFGCIDKNTTKVHNIKSYLLTTLYNAPATIDSYYRAEVAHDLYGS
ncbi:helix-turn-helix domain-containing protein [Christensenellaceae bacterium OttesenSCG-928-L17]|nr:helix-turn-helix domain-containing protein [Christensenellaceae bacterium OttesenSCG-928-L17]